MKSDKLTCTYCGNLDAGGLVLVDGERWHVVCWLRALADKIKAKGKKQ